MPFNVLQAVLILLISVSLVSLSLPWAVGYIGEFHPEVLEAWQIDMPTSGFEFEIRKPEA